MAKAKMQITSATIKKNNLWGQEKKVNYKLYLFTKPDNRDKDEYGAGRKNSEIIADFFKRQDFKSKFDAYIKDFMNGKIKKVKTINDKGNFAESTYYPDLLPTQFKNWNDVKNYRWDLVLQGAYNVARKAFKKTPTIVKSWQSVKGGKKATTYNRQQGHITGQLNASIQGEVKKS